MKKIFALLSATLAIFSCAKELEDSQAPVVDGEFKTVTFDVLATKTVMDDNGNVSWEAGDQLSLYYIVDGNVADEVIATADASGAKVTFTAQIPVDHEPQAYYAAYPKGSGTLDADGSFSINVAADNCDGTFKSANFAAAYSTAEDMTFQFKNAVGMIKVSLPENGVITRAKTGVQYPVTGIYIRGKETSPKLQGNMTVEIQDGEVTGFGDVDGAANINMTGLSQEAINSGSVYIPCAPADWTDGVCVRYLSSNSIIPAVLSKDGKAINVSRGYVLPLADVSSKVVFDYYVSANGSGDGLTEATPMSLAVMQELLNSVTELHPTLQTKMQYPCLRLNGTTFNFVSGTHAIESTITIPAGSITYRVNIDGIGDAVLDASAQTSKARVFDVFANAAIQNITISGADITSLGGANANGAAVRVNAGTKVTLENLVIKNCKANNGGAIFVQYSAQSTDENSILDCINCKFLTNGTSGGHGGVVMTASASGGGVLRFDECYFGENKVSGSGTNLSGGVLYSVTPVLAMFNKCTFYKNTANTYAYEIYMNDTDTRLAMNNCTFRGASISTLPAQGSLVSTRGYSIIANTTFWSDGPVGKWGTIGLGSNISLNDLNGSIVVNCMVYNKPGSTSYPAFYFHSSFNQNVQYCIYNGGTSNVATANVTNSTDLGLGTSMTGASTKANTEGPGTWYRAYTWPWQDNYPCPTLTEVRAVITSNTQIGQTFLDWLDSLDGALTTDIAGNPRPSNAMCPGSYQQDGVTANDN